jgi:hypothetical protein
MPFAAGVAAKRLHAAHLPQPMKSHFSFGYALVIGNLLQPSLHSQRCKSLLGFSRDQPPPTQSHCRTLKLWADRISMFVKKSCRSRIIPLRVMRNAHGDF